MQKTQPIEFANLHQNSDSHSANNLKMPDKLATTSGKSAALDKSAKFSDKQLLFLCKKYGRQALLWKWKFIGLLPEVKSRKLYEKKNCKSIYEFAAKYGGISRAQVDRAVNLNDRFLNVPVLKSMLQEGRISVNKLAKIASVVEIVEEDVLVEAVKKLSCRSVETYVRDIKYAVKSYENFAEVGGAVGSDSSFKIANGLGEPINDFKSVRVNKLNVDNNVAIWQGDGGDGDEVGGGEDRTFELKQELNLKESTLKKLLELQEKGIEIDELIAEMLDKRAKEIEKEKLKIGEVVMWGEGRKKARGKHPSRYVPVKVKMVVAKEYGNKCSVPSCKKEAKHLHHILPFSVVERHDPDFIKPLCREHHDIVHSVNEVYLRKKSVNC